MEKKDKCNAMILSIYHDLAEAFVETVVGGSTTEANIADRMIHFNIVAGDPIQYPTWDDHVNGADVIIFIARFLDVHSIEKIKNIYRYLPSEFTNPIGIFLLRDKGEIDFKISCPACGQKLWLRDTDVSKRGRCPNCKKPFVILSQLEYLKSQLMLPDAVMINYVVRQDADSGRAAIEKLLDSSPVGIRPMNSATTVEALSNATVRIQIQE